MALDHNVDDGINNNAISIPSCADEIVAPVLGDTNLFIHNCCMISPAILIPTPVHKIASSLGSLEIIKILHCSASPLKSDDKLISITPTKSENIDKTSNITAKTMVNLYFFMLIPPLMPIIYCLIFGDCYYVLLNKALCLIRLIFNFMVTINIDNQ